MRFNLLILLLTMLLSSGVLANGYKIDDEDKPPLDVIIDKGIEEDIIRNLDLLRNLEIVENLDNYESIVEIIEDDEDD